MERLADIDEVAYVRFASVYRQYQGYDSFHRRIEESSNNVQKNDMA